jgi:hypothetical protein
MQQEAAEIAAALAEFERMELREAEERAQREEERRRKEEEDIRAREVKRLMLIAERMQVLRTALYDINQTQQSMLISRHEARAQELHSIAASDYTTFDGRWTKRDAALESNLKSRIETVSAFHAAEIKSLISRHEEEENDAIFNFSRHLKGKPNREEREKAIIGKLKAAHENELTAFKISHKAAKEKLESTGVLERKALLSAKAIELQEMQERQLDCLFEFARTVIAHRRWFSAVVEKRNELLEKYSMDAANSRDEIGELLIHQVDKDANSSTTDSSLGGGSQRLNWASKPPDNLLEPHPAVVAAS